MTGSDYPMTVSGSEILGRTVRPDREYMVKLYNFKRPDKFSNEQITTVRLLHETIARVWAPAMSGLIGRSVGIQCRTVDQMTFEEFLHSVPPTGAFVPTALPPLKVPILIQMDGSLSALLIRTACGGMVPSGKELDTPSRPLTDIEGVILRDVIERLLPGVDEGWHNVIPIKSSVIDVTSDATTIRIVPPSEMIILGSLELSVENTSAIINFAIPYLTVESILGRLSAQSWYRSTRRDGAKAGFARAASLPVDVELFAELRSLPLADLRAVAEGKPLEIPGLAAGVAQLAAGGVPVAEVALHASELTQSEQLVLPATSYNSDPLIERLAGGEAERSSISGQVLSSVEALGRQINEVRHAVEEIREDRETLLAEVAERPLFPVDHSRQSDMDRRHHLDIAVALAGEDPATVAFVLSGLSAETAAAVLADVDPSLQPDIARSIATATGGNRTLHRKLVAFIGRRISRSLESTTSGGPDVVAQILNSAPRSVEKHVMETLRDVDNATFEEIAAHLFVFEDFVLVDPAAIAKLASAVSIDELALAMKGVPGEIVDHISEALDPETADALAHAIDGYGRVRRRDVEAAQRDLIEELRQLEKSGEVVIARPNEVVD